MWYNVTRCYVMQFDDVLLRIVWRNANYLTPPSAKTQSVITLMIDNWITNDISESHYGPITHTYTNWTQHSGDAFSTSAPNKTRAFGSFCISMILSRPTTYRQDTPALTIDHKSHPLGQQHFYLSALKSHATPFERLTDNCMWRKLFTIQRSLDPNTLQIPM